MSCCIGQASLGVHLTVYVVCYAANNVILTRNRQLPDDDRMTETCRSIFKSFNVNNLSVCIGWCADQVTLRSARCKDKNMENILWCTVIHSRFAP